MGSTLLTIPRELRDRIFANVLQSSTGMILIEHAPQHDDLETRNLKRKYHFKIFEFAGRELDSVPLRSKPGDRYRLAYPVNGELTFFLLRTCRQIYLESRQMFWTLNTLFLRLENFDPFTPTPMKWFPVNDVPIQKAQLEIHLGVLGRGNDRYHEALVKLAKWTRERELRSCIISVDTYRLENKDQLIIEFYAYLVRDWRAGTEATPRSLFVVTEIRFESVAQRRHPE